MKTIPAHRAEKIARNINAMDLSYQYSDDSRRYRFWSNLNDKLRKILATLSNEDRAFIKTFCNEDEAKFFNL